jgi:HK97 gp10 family phage protein
MSQGFRSKALLHAVTQGGEIVKREASARAPVRKSGRGGRLRDSMAVVKLKSTSKLAKVGVSWRKGRAARTGAFYGIMVEKGTKPRSKKDGASTGTMPSRPFLIPAYDSKRTEVARQIKIELSRLLRKAAKKGM